jgi:hypothetical protein
VLEVISGHVSLASGASAALFLLPASAPWGDFCLIRPSNVREILLSLRQDLGVGVQFQPESDLVLWFKTRTANAQASRKPMIVALARKLIIALWRYVNTGLVPEGFRLRSAA